MDAGDADTTQEAGLDRGVAAEQLSAEAAFGDDSVGEKLTHLIGDTIDSAAANCIR